MPTNDNALLFITIYTKMNLWCRNWNKTDVFSTYRNHIWRCFLVTSMLVTDFDNEMCWWQVKNVGDRHNDSVTNILNLSPS